MKRLKIEEITLVEFEIKAVVGNWSAELKCTKTANIVDNKFIKTDKFKYLGTLSDGEQYIVVSFSSFNDYRESTDDFIIEDVAYHTPFKYYGGDREHQLTFSDLIFREITKELNKMPYITELEYIGLKTMKYKPHCICSDVCDNFWYKIDFKISDYKPIKIDDFYYIFLKSEDMEVFDGDRVIYIKSLQGIKTDDTIIWHFATDLTVEDITNNSLDDLEYESFKISKITAFNS